jgi:hypothetical protein
MLDIPVLIDDPAGNANPQPRKPLDLRAIATEMMESSQVSLARHGAALRPGKSPADLRHALKKARSFGRGRQDFTLAMLEVHLKHLLQTAPSS